MRENIRYDYIFNEPSIKIGRQMLFFPIVINKILMEKGR